MRYVKFLAVAAAAVAIGFAGGSLVDLGGDPDRSADRSADCWVHGVAQFNTGPCTHWPKEDPPAHWGLMDCPDVWDESVNADSYPQGCRIAPESMSRYADYLRR